MSTAHDPHRRWPLVLIAFAALAVAVAPLGLESLLRHFSMQGSVLPLLLPVLSATLAAAIFALCTRRQRVARALIVFLCALALSILSSCALGLVRIAQVMG